MYKLYNKYNNSVSKVYSLLLNKGWFTCLVEVVNEDFQENFWTIRLLCNVRVVKIFLESASVD